jgi:hypothetical protein
MKYLIIFLLTQTAHASLLSPMAKLTCGSDKGKIEITLNNDKFHSLDVKRNEKAFRRCTFAVTDESHSSRGPEIKKTLYIEMKSCDGKDTSEALSPVLKKGFIVFAGIGTYDRAQVHTLEESQAIPCTITDLQLKKLQKYHLPKK